MTAQRQTRRRFLGAATLALTSAGLVACGGAGSVSATSSATSSGTVGAAASTGATTAAPTASSATAATAATTRRPATVQDTTVSAKASAPAASTGKTEVWATWGAGSIVQKGYEASVALLNQQQPSVQAAYVTAAPWPTKFLTAAAGGVPPDAIICGTGQAMQVVAWSHKGLLVPLDSYVTADKVAATDFYAPAWREDILAGKQYALPLEVDPNFPLMYNKALFRQVGLDPTKPPATIAEFDAANQKLFAKTGDTITRMGSTAPWAVSSDANTLLTWFTMFGGGFLDATSGKLNVTTPQNAAALDWLAVNARAYNLDAVTAFSKTFGTNGVAGALADGKIAMAPFVSATYQQLVDLTKTGATHIEDFDFGFLPTASAAQTNKGWLGGFAVGQPHGAPHPDKSWALIKFMTATPQGTDAWASVNGFLPAYRPSPFLARVANQPGFAWYLKVLDAAQTTPPTIAGWGDVPADAFHAVLYDPLQNKATAQDALASFQSVVSAFLGTYA
jgi:multiple sugar transport system substrate-binding protein